MKKEKSKKIEVINYIKIAISLSIYIFLCTNTFNEIYEIIIWKLGIGAMLIFNILMDLLLIHKAKSNCKQIIYIQYALYFFQFLLFCFDKYTFVSILLTASLLLSTYKIKST